MGRAVSRWSALRSDSVKSLELGWAWKSSSDPRAMWPPSTFSGARTSRTCSGSPRSSRSARSSGAICGKRSCDMLSQRHGHSQQHGDRVLGERKILPFLEHGIRDVDAPLERLNDRETISGPDVCAGKPDAL